MEPALSCLGALRLAGNRHHRRSCLTCWRCAAISKTAAASSPSTRRSSGWSPTDARLAGAFRRRGAGHNPCRRRGELRPGSARSGSAAPPKAIRRSGCRRSSSARAIISPIAGRPVFTRLIYPVPMHGGLGIHVTLDLAGRMRFGPDVRMDRARRTTTSTPAAPRRSTRASATYLAAACPTMR